MGSSRIRDLSDSSGRGTYDVTIAATSESPVGLGGEMVIRWESTGLSNALGELDRQLDMVLGEGPRSLVLDMSAVVRVSSTTIAGLLWTRRRCSSRGVRLVLSNPSRRCLETLKRVGLLGSLEVEPLDGRLWERSSRSEPK